MTSGKSRTERKHLPRHADAIVIGAGIGGLLAARALADHADEVLVLDRDALPDQVGYRKNIPQGHHVHVLLARGYQIMSSLFPGIDEELIASGAVPAQSSRDLTWFQEGDYHRAPHQGLDELLLSRSLLEFHLRQRVAALPNVSIIDDTHVTSLVTDSNRQRVTGVMAAIGADDRSATEIDAPLVVECCGRGTQLPSWLQQLGYPTVTVDRLDANARYATRRFRHTGNAGPHRLATVIASLPSSPTGASGVAIAQEEDSWVVTLSGRNQTQPPTELGAFTAYAASLEVSDIHDFLQGAEPVDDGATYRFPQSQWRRFDRMDRFPEGLVPFADTICSFNPIYGQGMSIAAIEAQALARCLESGRAHLAKRFLGAAIPAIGAAWSMVASSDRPFSSQPPAQSLPERFIDWYIGKLLLAAHHDAVVSDAFHRVADLVDMPQRLLRPSIAGRVLTANLRPHRVARSRQ